jgi:hypothetical protein
MEIKEVQDLEPQQYQRMYWEEDVPLTDVRKSLLRKFVYIGCSLCLLFITVGFFLTFPDQIELPFIIKNNQSEQIYRFSYPVYVIEKYIQPHNAVVKGQRLIRITSPEIVSLINNYRESEQNLQNFSNQKAPSVEKEKEIIANRIEENNNAIKEVQRDLVILENTWKSNLAAASYESEAASKRYQVMKKLYEEKATSKFELMEYETKMNKAADALESAKQNYEKAKFNLNTLYNRYLLDNHSATEELHKLNFDVQYDSASLYNQYALAKNKIENTFGDFEFAGGGDLILKAAENGVASYIFEGEKEVAASAILLKLIPRNSNFYAWVKSPPSQIGKLSINKQVKLKVASFPFYEWGVMSGHIENLSLTPDESGNYSAKISIDNFGQLRPLMQIGMNGDATIILEERTFYYYFFHHIKRAYYNATKQNVTTGNKSVINQ